MKSNNDKGTQEREASVPIHASSVIIIRDATEDMYEIFLMRRHRNQSFMGGAYVFPGGRLDDMDCSSELTSCICGISPSNAKLILQEPGLPDDIACGLFCAALRETFEEAGILLAYFSEGNLVNFLDKKIRQNFSQYRKRLMNSELSFIEISREENILFAFDLLLPYAHWITPEAEAAFKTKSE